METKIIKVVFGGRRYAVTNKRTRTDYGQQFEFVDITLPETFEVVFSNSNTSAGTGKKMIGSNQRCLIPDEYLKTGQPIYAWILLHDDEDDGRHMYSIKSPVDDMPDTSPEEPTPVEQSVISQAITALNSAVTTTTQKAQEASASADRAEHAAEGVEGYAERAEAAQGAAESARDIALEAKASAQASAATATEKASEAISSATTASQSALTAESASESAQEYASASAESASQASQSADTASNKASDASEYASNANTSAQTASQKASEAAQSASTASQAKTDAETAKTASETAQGLAESASDNAITAKTSAEDARDEAQDIVDGIAGKVEQIDSNTERIESLEDDRYKPYPTDTASGSIASFPDGADGIPLKSCIVQIEPVQAGEGDPSPENVRPISGWTGCEVQRTGKNLLNADTYYGDYKQSDGSYYLSASNLSIILIPLKAFIGKTVTFSAEVTIGETTINLRARAVINGRGTNGTPATNNATSTISITATPVTDDDYIHITYGSGGSNPVTLRNVQLEEGSVVTDFTPFGEIIPITFPTEAGTVYGGYIDPINGELVDSMASMTLNASTGFSVYASGANTTVFRRRNAVPSGTAIEVNQIANMLRFSGTAYIASDDDANTFVVGSSGNLFLQLSNSIASTVEQLNTFLSDTPLVVFYNTNTPQTYLLTPQEIKTLLGQNNLWADCGDTEVTYRADTTLYITKKITEAVSALS